MPTCRLYCAAIPTELAEAELFGHVRGAFTGATANRAGFFAEASGGTLVLDEVGELPMAVQAKLLRALQEGEIQPVGSGRVERVDVRIVAATHRDLHAEAAAGRFREDLYYRLAVIELLVPALRERQGDIPALAVELARHYADKFGTGALTLEPALVDALAAAPWPGNVRQLENTIARLTALANGPVLTLADYREQSGLAVAVADPAATTTAIAVDGEPEPPPSPDLGPSLREQVEAFERGLIARTLAAVGGNQSEAARRLGTSRVTLLDKVKKYGLGTRRPD